MNVSLNYGHNSITLNIPDKNYFGTLNPKEVKEIENPVDEVKKALASPIGSKKLKEIVKCQDKVIILVSDITRPATSTRYYWAETVRYAMLYVQERELLG